MVEKMTVRMPFHEMPYEESIVTWFGTLNSLLSKNSVRMHDMRKTIMETGDWTPFLTSKFESGSEQSTLRFRRVRKFASQLARLSPAPAVGMVTMQCRHARSF